MALLVPIANAAGLDVTSFGNAVSPIISNIISPIIALMFAVALVVFVYGGVMMIIKGDDAEARSNSKKALVGGIIGMFIMLSAWGFIYLIANTVKAL